MLLASADACATGITLNLGDRDTHILFSVVVLVIPVVLLTGIYAITCVFLRKHARHHLRKAGFAFVALLLIVFANAVGAYFWY
jgi:hypothetical protein